MSQPIFALNHDVLSEIFEISVQSLDILPEQFLPIRSIPLPVLDKATDALTQARRISEVCTTWRKSMLDLPALWGRLINLDSIRITRSRSGWADEVLRRSAKTPLSIQGHIIIFQKKDGDKRLADFLLKVLETEWERVENLSIAFEDQRGEFTLKLSELMTRAAPTLRSLTLDVDCIIPVPDYFRYPVSLGQHAPALTSFRASTVALDPTASWIPNLRRLRLEDIDWHGAIQPEFEALTALLQRMHHIQHIDLRKFYTKRRNVPSVKSRDPITVPELCSFKFTGGLAECNAIMTLLNPDHIFEEFQIRALLPNTTSRIPGVEFNQFVNLVVPRLDVYLKESTYSSAKLIIRYQSSEFCIALHTLRKPILLTVAFPYHRPPYLLADEPADLMRLFRHLSGCKFETITSLVLEVNFNSAKREAETLPLAATMFASLRNLVTLKASVLWVAFITELMTLQPDILSSLRCLSTSLNVNIFVGGEEKSGWMVLEDFLSCRLALGRSAHEVHLDNVWVWLSRFGKPTFLGKPDFEGLRLTWNWGSRKDGIDEFVLGRDSTVGHRLFDKT